MRITLDIETTRNASKIWMVITRKSNGEMQCHTNAQTLKPLLEQCEEVIGHNLVAFDSYHLRRLWNLTIPLEKMTDTLLLSRLYRPDLEGGHSLASWGRKLGIEKIEYEEFDSPDLTMMREYCEQDVLITERLHNHLTAQMKIMGFKGEAIRLEHEVQAIVQEQIRAGFWVDEKALFLLRVELVDKLSSLEKRLQDTFEPTVVQLKTKTKIIPFNPGSRKQIADRLVARGWKPKEKTEKGNIIVDEEVLDTIDMPEARLLSEYFMLQKRLSQVEQWVQYLGDDGRIHGDVITNGAVTGRMTHSKPNMAQVPANGVPYGSECRALFGAPPGRKLVGVDASGLELRMLAHYLQDADYIKEVVAGDVHWKNTQALGLVEKGLARQKENPGHTEKRNWAKTFIYAFIYGAGAAKIGSIVGKGWAEGQRLIARFLEALPSFAGLKTKIEGIAEKGHLPGLDGRRIHVRQPHKALNTLLQGAGAITMKKALTILKKELTARNLDAIIVANVHDEFQIETAADQAEEVGKLGVWAIEEAGRQLNLRVPLTGEYRVGQNWRETH